MREKTNHKHTTVTVIIALMLLSLEFEDYLNCGQGFAVIKRRKLHIFALDLRKIMY